MNHTDCSIDPQGRVTLFNPRRRDLGQPLGHVVGADDTWAWSTPDGAKAGVCPTRRSAIEALVVAR